MTSPSRPLATQRVHIRPFSPEWAAGFLDGEGCIHIAKQTYPPGSGRSTTYRLRVSFSQNNREVLKHLKKGLGIQSSLNECGRTLGQNRQNYVLTYDGRWAHQLVERLSPYLVRKYPEAQVALRYWADAKPGQRFGPKGVPPAITKKREHYYAKLRRLK